MLLKKDEIIMLLIITITAVGTRRDAGRKDGRTATCEDETASYSG